MNFKSMTKVYALPVILIIIAGMAFFAAGRDKSEPVAVVQQAAVVQATQVKAINAVAIAPAPIPTTLPVLTTQQLLAKAQTEIIDPETGLINDVMVKIIVDLLESKTTSSMMNDYRGQVVDWLRTASSERQWTYPLSPKQAAWSDFILCPSTAPNPYSIVELYPDGKPAR